MCVFRVCVFRSRKLVCVQAFPFPPCCILSVCVFFIFSVNLKDGKKKKDFNLFYFISTFIWLFQRSLPPLPFASTPSSASLLHPHLTFPSLLLCSQTVRCLGWLPQTPRCNSIQAELVLRTHTCTNAQRQKDNWCYMYMDRWSDSIVCVCLCVCVCVWGCFVGVVDAGQIVLSAERKTAAPPLKARLFTLTCSFKSHNLLHILSTEPHIFTTYRLTKNRSAVKSKVMGHIWILLQTEYLKVMMLILPPTLWCCNCVIMKWVVI